MKRLNMVCATLMMVAYLTLSPINKEKISDVKTGEVKLAKNTLVSNNFVNCSALAIDYKNIATLAHAPPIAREYKLTQPNFWNETIHLNNVVEKSVAKLKENGINPAECEAYIHAGNKKSYDSIISSLKKYGVRIAEGKYEKEGFQKRRSIIFNPASNKLTIDYKVSR